MTDGLQDQDLRPYERMIKARFYAWMVRTYDGGDWKKAASDLVAKTGINYPHETLRQNIEPSSKKSSVPPHQIRKKERLKALKDFLISVRYLSEEELQETPQSSYIEFAISLFINSDDETQDNSNLEKFKGRYTGEQQTKDNIEYIELYIDYIAPGIPVRATELSSVGYSDADGIEDSNLSVGWAVCNTQGFYSFFLSDVFTPKCYLVLQTSPGISAKSDVTEIAVLRYESAWNSELQKQVTEVEEGVEIIEYNLPKSLKDICVFLTRT
ncbi:MAG: hypothetical protein AB2799_17945 [Candidatus Thiodiazotropha sp.]